MGTTAQEIGMVGKSILLAEDDRRHQMLIMRVRRKVTGPMVAPTNEPLVK